MAHLELSNEERDVLAEHLREHIAQTRYPLAPTIRPLKSILAKLDPQPAPEVVPSVAARYPVPASKRKRRASQW
jgi:hypothetical protein